MEDLNTPLVKVTSEGLDTHPPLRIIRSGLLYFDTIGHQTAKVRGWEMGARWVGIVRGRDGGTEVEVQVWSD